MEDHIEKYFSELEKDHFLRLAVYHVDEQIELNQKRMKTRWRDLIYTIVYKRKQFQLK